MKTMLENTKEVATGSDSSETDIFKKEEEGPRSKCVDEPSTEENENDSFL